MNIRVLIIQDSQGYLHRETSKTSKQATKQIKNKQKANQSKTKVVCI